MTKAGYLLIAACLTLAIADMWLVNAYGLKSSESWFIRRVAESHPLFVFSIGVLIGHFFAGMTPE